MSWSRKAAFAATLGLALALSGCFTPLYSEKAHPGLVSDLRAIEVQPIAGRIGHYLGENLIADLNGTGVVASPPKYRLTVKISTNTMTPTVNSMFSVATSTTMTGDAEYTLTKVDGGKDVVKGTANAAAAIDRTSQRYANLRASRDAEIRLARSLSDEITSRLSSALAATTPSP